MYDVFGPKHHPKFYKNPLLDAQIIEVQIFETCTRYLVQNGIPNSIKVSLSEMKIMEIRFLDVYEVFGPKWHPEIHKRELGSTFLVRGGPRRARPARPASLAASAGRWAWPAGGPRWQPMGQLAAIPSCSSWQWVRAEVERKEAGQTTAPPPHSYHRRWVIWYIFNNCFIY